MCCLPVPIFRLPLGAEGTDGGTSEGARTCENARKGLMRRIEILKSFSAAQLRPIFSLIAFAGEQTGTANMCLRTFCHLLSIFKCIGDIPISYHIIYIYIHIQSHTRIYFHIIIY